MRRRISIAYLLYAAYALGFAALLLVNPAFGPIDDHNFAQTLLIGKPLPWAIWTDIGRFFPLNGQEYNLIGLFSTDPTWFYAVNAVELLVLAWVMSQLIRRVSSRPLLIVGLPALLLLTPGVTASWFRLLVPERGATLFFALFLLSYLKAQETPSSFFVGLAVVFANVALYYKEPGFLLLGVFAGFHLVLSWKSSLRRLKILDFSLLASSSVFAILYYVLVFSQRGSNLYTASYEVFAFLPRAIFSYASTDPALMLGLVPLALFRLWRIGRRLDKPEPLYDSMILGALTYVLVYFVLEIRAVYYLLPAYVFALPAMVHFFAEYWRRRATKMVVGVVLVAYAVSALPIGLSVLSSNKYVPINHTKTIDFLSAELPQSPSVERPMIFLDGVNRGTGMEYYESLKRFLEYRQVSFDLGSDIPVDREILFDADPNSPYAAYRNREPSAVRNGDYVVVCESCVGSLTVDREYLAGFEDDYELVFFTESPLAIPEFSARNLAKLVVSRFLSDEDRGSLIGSSENLFRGPDYHVFVKFDDGGS